MFTRPFLLMYNAPWVLFVSEIFYTFAVENINNEHNAHAITKGINTPPKKLGGVFC